MAIAIASFAMSLTACSSDDNEVSNELSGKENEGQSAMLAAYAIDSQGTRSGGEAKTAVFTDEENCVLELIQRLFTNGLKH